MYISNKNIDFGMALAYKRVGWGRDKHKMPPPTYKDFFSNILLKIRFERVDISICTKSWF